MCRTSALSTLPSGCHEPRKQHWGRSERRRCGSCRRTEYAPRSAYTGGRSDARMDVPPDPVHGGLPTPLRRHLLPAPRSGRNTVVVAEPTAARRVIRGDPSVFRAGDANGILKPVVGPASLLVLDGDEHMQHRRILLPAFGAHHAPGFAEAVEGATRERIASWRAGETLKLQHEMEAISLEATLRLALGRGPEDRLAQVSRPRSRDDATLLISLHPAALLPPRTGRDHAVRSGCSRCWTSWTGTFSMRSSKGRRRRPRTQATACRCCAPRRMRTAHHCPTGRFATSS